MAIWARGTISSIDAFAEPPGEEKVLSDDSNIVALREGEVHDVDA